MKRLGRFDVWIIVQHDGVETRRELEHRTIYQDASGACFINWLKDRKRVHPHSTPDTYQLTVNYRAVKAMLGSEMMDRILGA